MKNKLPWRAGAKKRIMLIEPNIDRASAYRKKIGRCDESYAFYCINDGSFPLTF
jgi:hypothetical protein